MANKWGESGTKWGYGLWGEQSDTLIAVSGIEITSSLGTTSAFNETGWGRRTWGSADWGEGGAEIVSVTGQQITSAVGTPLIASV